MVATITKEPEEETLTKWDHWDCMKWMGDARTKHRPEYLRDVLTPLLQNITDIEAEIWRATPIEEILCEQQSRGTLDCATHTLTAIAHILNGTAPDPRLCLDTTKVDHKMERTRALLQKHFDSETEEYALIHGDHKGTTAVEWSIDDTQGKDNVPPKRFEERDLSRIGNTKKMITDDIIQVMITELLVMGPTGILAQILHRRADTGLADQLWHQLGQQERINHGALHEIKLKEIIRKCVIIELIKIEERKMVRRE